MDRVLADDRFLRRQDVLCRDRLVVTAVVDLQDAFARERVHKPWLAAGQLPGTRNGIWFEYLPGRLRVLGIEPDDVVFSEVAERQVFGDDVERTRIAERLPVGTNPRLVVADVAHSHKRDRRWERRSVPRNVTVSQLAQERHERVVRKAVHLVEEHGERLLRLLGQEGEKRLDVQPRRRRKKRGDGRIGVADELLEDWMTQDGVAHPLHDLRDSVSWVREPLDGLDGEVEGVHLALRVDCPDKRLQRRRLAGLTRGVQHEVAALLDDAHDARQPFKRRQHVVFVRKTRPRDIEAFLHAANYTLLSHRPQSGGPQRGIT